MKRLVTVWVLLLLFKIPYSFQYEDSEDSEYSEEYDFEEGDETDALNPGLDCTQNPETGNCFTLLGAKKKYEQAIEICRDKGGFLPILIDSRDFSTFTQFKPESWGFWIGLKKIEESYECIGSFEVK